ncbi:hypothetical protein Bhyg_05931, partial [Pseudolycoriella hygida]
MSNIQIFKNFYGLYIKDSRKIRSLKLFIRKCVYKHLTESEVCYMAVNTTTSLEFSKPGSTKIMFGYAIQSNRSTSPYRVLQLEKLFMGFQNVPQEERRQMVKLRVRTLNYIRDRPVRSDEVSEVELDRDTSDSIGLKLWIPKVQLQPNADDVLSQVVQSDEINQHSQYSDNVKTLQPDSEQATDESMQQSQTDCDTMPSA